MAASPLELLNPLSGKEKYTEVNCAVSRFAMAKGMARSEALVFDTTRMTVIGDGDVNLRTEALSIRLEPSPKSGVGGDSTGKVGLSLGALARPFKLGGTLAEPRLAIDPAGSVLALGKVLGGTALFGPAGIAAALLSTSGPGIACLEAIEAARIGVRALAPRQGTSPTTTRQRQSQPSDAITKPVERTLKSLEGALKGLFGK